MADMANVVPHVRIGDKLKPDFDMIEFLLVC